MNGAKNEKRLRPALYLASVAESASNVTVMRP